MQLLFLLLLFFDRRLILVINKIDVYNHTRTTVVCLDLHVRMIDQHRNRQLLLLLCLASFSCSMGNSFGTLFSSSSSFTKQVRPLEQIRNRPTVVTSNLLRHRGGGDVPSTNNNSDGSTAGSSSNDVDANVLSQDPAVSSLSASSNSSNDLNESKNDINDSKTTASPMGPNSSPPGLLRKTLPTFPWHKVPNYLTYARCLAIPALIVQFYTSAHVHKNVHSSLIFAIASITDYLDGYLARRWDICSPFGAFLDPVADKLMVSTALILLAGKYGYAVAIPSAIILGREIAVSALREWMASRGKRDVVKVGFQGKVKTAATMVALTIILSVPDSIGLGWHVNQLLSCFKPSWNCLMNLGMVLLFVSSFVTVTSGSVYFKTALMEKE